MLDASSRDGRLNFDTAVQQLIMANYAPRDGNSRILPMSKDQRSKFISEKMAQINLEEITQGYLNFSVQLVPQVNKLQFAIVETQQIKYSPVTPFVQLLAMQDSFLISSMFYYLQNFTCESGKLTTPDFSIGNDFTPITNVSANWNNNHQALTPFMAGGCSMFWVGSYLTLTINKRVIIPKWDCYQHFFNPQTQYSQDNAIPQAYPPRVKDQRDGSVDGWVYMQPNVVLGGGRQNVLELTLPGNIPVIQPFNVYGYGDTFLLTANVMVRGILMQNSTAVK